MTFMQKCNCCNRMPMLKKSAIGGLLSVVIKCSDNCKSIVKESHIYSFDQLIESAIRTWNEYQKIDLNHG